MKISDFDILSFDCYGTLVDWENEILSGLMPKVCASGKVLSNLDILSVFLDTETEVISANPSLTYKEALTEVFLRFCEILGVSSTKADAERFGTSIGTWALFPDTDAALRQLSQRHKLVILSNIDDESIHLTTRQITSPFYQIYTAQQIGSYKPNQINFQFMLDRLGEQGVQPEQVLHVSVSLFHDIAPASALGLRTCWINRGRTENGTLATPNGFQQGVAPDFKFHSLQELVDNYS